MSNHRRTSRSAESEWVSSNFFVEGTKLPPEKPEPKAHIMDSAWDLKNGLVVDELDTIPAELMKLFE